MAFDPQRVLPNEPNPNPESRLNMSEVLKQIASLKIVPVVILNDAAHANPLADALVAGGLPIAEVTFRTAAAEQAIKTLAARGDLLVGAGTVLDIPTAQRAVDAGAKYIVAPGFSPKLVQYCLDHQIPILPGVATPTDLTLAVEHGLSAVKFFPAETLGGPKALKALAAPFTTLKFVPTGGINAANLGSYLSLPQTLACGGSWMVAKDLLAARKFNEVTRLTLEAMALVAKSAQ
jgi:2-dehydro-3-deoxyphosphogluconate aldolase/(4S)-4-hydroxy-2-oxoglutarate aldolase